MCARGDETQTFARHRLQNPGLEMGPTGCRRTFQLQNGRGSSRIARQRLPTAVGWVENGDVMERGSFPGASTEARSS